MKKLAMAVTAVSLSAMMLAGCGDSAAEETQESTAAETQESSEAAETEETVEEKVYADEAYMDYLNVDDYVELGNYFGVEVTLEAPYVTDAQVENYIQTVLNNNPVRTEITDRAVKDGDVTNIDYVGKRDGVAFDGGTGSNQELVIGSGSFIDGFEEGVIGMKIGETKDLNLTFPDPYKINPDMSGAEVVFTVTLNNIYEEAEAQLNDEFVAGLEIENIETVDDYRQYVYDGLMENAQYQYDMNVESAVLNAVHENASFKKVPEAMAERYYDRLVSNMSYQAALYGMDLEMFMLYGYGMEPEQYEQDMKDSAQQAAEQILMLQAIAEKEGLTVSDEEMEEDIAAKAAEYGYETEEYKELIGSEMKGYREFVMSEKVTAYLLENAKITQTEPETGAETESGTEAEIGTETETADKLQETQSAAKSAEEPETETESASEAE